MGEASGTVTFLFTDIEGSTAMLTRLGNRAYAEVLAEHHRLVREALAANDGNEVDTQGDAFFALFASPRACAVAAVAAQRSLAAGAWPDGEHVRVRMGIHHGEALETATGPVGLEVHRAARVAAVAHGGQIVVSEDAATLLRHSLPDGASLHDLGQHRLKDLGRPERIFQLNADGLDARFPPLRSLDNPELEHNLPVQLTSFVGRERELEEIHRLVDESRLVTLAGPGGSGKTRLALQVAADLLDGSGDGVWLADLSPLGAHEQVAREVAGVLGVRDAAGRSLVDTVVEALQYRNLFLIVDNCEHLVDAVAELVGAIVRQCPNVWVLATSREALAVAGERVYRVPPLSLPSSDTATDPESLAGSEAVRLFVERAREHRPEFTLDAANAATVASLCRHLDGIPLALELAAARVRSMSVEDVEARLGQRFRLLSSRSRTAAARQQTLEGAIAWSYELLDEPEKLVFACLSVFAASFDLAAAESVCHEAAGFEDFEVVDLVQSLVDKSLIQTGLAASGSRYRMLETIAQYAAERLAEAGDGRAGLASEAHAAHYLAVAEEAAPHLNSVDQTQWMQRLEADYDNIRAALAHLSTDPRHGTDALRMAAALHWFWSAGLGDTAGEARDLVTVALAHPEARSATTERAGALLSLGLVQERLGEADAARENFRAAVAIARDVGDHVLLAEALSHLAFILYLLGDRTPAQDAAEEALDVASAYGSPHIQALAHDRLAAVASIDDPEAARRHFEDALRLYELAGSRRSISVTYNNLANFEMTVGDLVSARAHLEAAVEYAVTPDGRAFALMNLGFVSVLEGDLDAAAANYRDALRQLVRLGSVGYAPYALLGLAVCSASSSDEQRPAILHGAADAMLEAQGIPWQPAEADLREKGIAALRQRMGDRDFELGYGRGHQMSGPDSIALALEP